MNREQIGPTSRLSIEEVRRRLAAIPIAERCDPACPGWVTGPTWVERCDDCSRKVPEAMRLGDEDMHCLPEVQASMRADAARCDVGAVNS